MREIRPSGSMSGRWKRGMAGLVRHRHPKGPEPDRPRLNHRATSRLYSSPFRPLSLGPLISLLHVFARPRAEVFGTHNGSSTQSIEC
jgi:hypothetical protein